MTDSHDRLSGALLGAFFADAHALGAHWVYDPAVIAAAAQDPGSFHDPLAEWHQGKRAGDFTHYGDQMLWLLRDLATGGGFDLDRFAQTWRSQIASYDGYMDHACKHTLAALNDGADLTSCGSDSMDLSVVGRMVPLFVRHAHEPEVLFTHIRAHTRLTHSAELEGCALYFARVLLAVHGGAEVRTALLDEVGTAPANVQEWVEAGRACQEPDVNAAIGELGPGCSAPGSVAGVVYLLLRYADLTEALAANVAAGGDSSARGMLIGAILGLDQTLPPHVDTLKHLVEIQAATTRLRAAIYHREADRTVSASSGGGQIPVWTTEAGQGDRPGVLLVPAIFGPDEGTKILARDLAAVGAHVWMVDPFWRTAPGVLARDKEGFAKGGARARGMDEALATADFADLIKAMAKEPGCNGKVVVLGICFAGKFALLLTSQGHAAAGATFHGARMVPLVGLAETITAPLSLHFSDQDVAIPLEDVATLREAFQGHDNVEIFLHHGVNHGFGDPGSPNYDPGVYRVAMGAVRGLIAGLSQ